MTNTENIKVQAHGRALDVEHPEATNADLPYPLGSGGFL